MSPIQGVLNITDKRTYFHAFPFFYSAKVACVGYIGARVAVYERSSYCLAPLTSESARTYLSLMVLSGYIFPCV